MSYITENYINNIIDKSVDDVTETEEDWEKIKSCKMPYLFYEDKMRHLQINIPKIEEHHHKLQKTPDFQHLVGKNKDLKYTHDDYIELCKDCMKKLSGGKYNTY